jgi:hypothetical protein
VTKVYILGVLVNIPQCTFYGVIRVCARCLQPYNDMIVHTGDLDLRKSRPFMRLEEPNLDTHDVPILGYFSPTWSVITVNYQDGNQYNLPDGRECSKSKHQTVSL